MPPTLMEAHAALGPIMWTNAGMHATTTDGFVAEIVPAHSDLPWIVKLDEPPDAHGIVQVWGYRAADLRKARAVAAFLIGRFRDAERRRIEASNYAYALMAHMAQRVAVRGSVG